MKKFYAVWRIDGGQPPSHRHETLDEACAEAERLAKQTLKTYYVLETVKVVHFKETPVVWSNL